MTKTLRIALTMIILLLLATLPAWAAEEADRYFPLSQATQNTFSTYYVDLKTLHHVPGTTSVDFRKNPDQLLKDKGYVQAWVKVEYVKTGAKEVVESLKAQGKNVTGYDKLAFSLQLLRIKPASQEVVLLVQADYDLNGKLLGKNSHPIDKWVPYSVEPRIKEICETLLTAQRAMYASEGRQ